MEKKGLTVGKISLFSLFISALLGCQSTPRVPSEELAGFPSTPDTLPAGDVASAKMSGGLPRRECGFASWYGRSHDGRRTASGERFSSHKKTAAHRTLGFFKKVTVLNAENGKRVVVRVNDRGPTIDGVIIDLSQVAFATIASPRVGKVKVCLYY